MNAAATGTGKETREEARKETGEEAGDEVWPRRKGGRRKRGRKKGPRRKGGRTERGSGSVLLLGAGLLLLMLFCAVLLLLQTAVAANRAATAADLSALAAADTARGLREGDACTVAAEVAGRNGAALTGCAVNAGDHSVQVDTEVAVRLVPWPATGRARAGPPP